MSSKEARSIWPRGSQEHSVERFYQHGAERYGDHHGGMLNFGLWTNGASSYHAASRNLVEHVARSIGIGPQSRLLDVACGMGGQDIFMAEAFRPVSIVGLDVTWKHVVAARERAEREGLADRIDFRHGTAIELPFGDRSFTHVMCIEGGEHFDTRERFLREALRVLEPGGQIGLTDYTARRLPKTVGEQALTALVRRLWHVPSANVTTTDGLGETLRRVGFESVRVEAAGSSVVPGYYGEGRKPENVREMDRIRGLLVSRVSLWIDHFTYRLYARGLLDYVFVFAARPA
jgi:microcystin synthetase protein McyJ